MVFASCSRESVDDRKYSARSDCCAFDTLMIGSGSGVSKLSDCKIGAIIDGQSRAFGVVTLLEGLVHYLPVSKVSIPLMKYLLKLLLCKEVLAVLDEEALEGLHCVWK